MKKDMLFVFVLGTAAAGSTSRGLYRQTVFVFTQTATTLGIQVYQHFPANLPSLLHLKNN